MVVDESKINPNLGNLYRHFDDVTAKYFLDGKPRPEYFEETSCYNCGSTKIQNAFTVNKFRHVRCAECGMVYVNPRLKERVAEKLYNEPVYTEFYRIKLLPSLNYRKKVLGPVKYKQAMQHFKKPGKVLDIGCGLGELLAVFKEKGWDCTGIETNEYAAEYARENFNLNIINKSIFAVTEKETYDLIMLWGVLEHFTDPVKALRMIRLLLKDDGVLLIEVPSADSVLVRYYEQTEKNVDRIIEGDRHLMLFSVNGLTNMLDRTGFKPVNVLSNGLDIATLNRLEPGNPLTIEQISGIQNLLDISLQGDLLRGFFTKSRARESATGWACRE